MKQMKNILVVEDSLSLQKAIKNKLNKNGFNVITARSAEKAEELIQDEKNMIDVIWLDHYLLGKENGLDFVAKIKNDEKWANKPIFVVSNTATPDKISSYIQLGISKYYTKSDNRLDNIISDINDTLN